MRTVHWIALAVVFAAQGAAVFFLHQAGWIRFGNVSSETESAPHAAAPGEVQVLRISAEARKNLKLVAQPPVKEPYWRWVRIPGEVVDRPGISDRGVTAPAVGVVAAIHAFPGDTVRVGDPLFTLQVFSEYLQNTQSELFKASRENVLLAEQRKRLEGLVEDQAIPKVKLIELESQVRRQNTLIQSYRQDLLTRGFSSTQIDGVAEGRFVSTIDIAAPPHIIDMNAAPDVSADALKIVKGAKDGPTYEVQELKIELGQQVQAGQLLSILANHHALYLEGHAFKNEAPFLENAIRETRSVEVEFAEDDESHWPEAPQKFEIRHLANTIDPASRTFDFFIPLTNQSRTYEKDGRTFIVWRFRPGQRVRLHVPVEEFKKALVLPAGAVAREGPEAYVFVQNGDLFRRTAVHVLHEDRFKVAIADDGALAPGLYVAHSSAATLNRVLKAQAASGVRADVHVHADGSIHAAH
jgi:membrane fusion protein, heavy metal efflux system